LAVTGVSIYQLLPSIVSVFSSWRSLRHLDWPFAVLMLLLETASYLCQWELDRIALGWDGWLTVACAQLAGNALGRVVPGSATPFSVILLRDAGLETGRAAAGLTTSTLLQIATALALPVLGNLPRCSLAARGERILVLAVRLVDELRIGAERECLAHPRRARARCADDQDWGLGRSVIRLRVGPRYCRTGGHVSPLARLCDIRSSSLLHPTEADEAPSSSCCVIDAGWNAQPPRPCHPGISQGPPGREAVADATNVSEDATG
jgi:hypothetical protein